MSQTIKLADNYEAVVEQQRNNPVIGRRELVLKVYHIGVGTPSRKAIIEGVASALGVDKNLVVIRRVDTSYGAGISVVVAHVYNDRKTLEVFEPKHLMGRDTGQKLKKGGGKGGKQG